MYKLTYRTAKSHTDGLTGEVGLFTEQVEENLILQRMKEIQNEHNATVGKMRALPQFIHFFPIEKVEPCLQ